MMTKKESGTNQQSRARGVGTTIYSMAVAEDGRSQVL
jgi:hypothetical protein